MTPRFLLPALVVASLCGPLGAADAPPPPRAEIYRQVDDIDLRLWIYGDPEPEREKPAIVFFFGGGWTSGTPAHFEPQARHFAARGMIAITVDYRVKSRHGVKPVECVRDAKAAVAWVREHAGRLGIDPGRIAAAGGSAGGHLAACTGTLPGFGSDERPNALILFNPACVLADLGEWKACGFGAKSSRRVLGTEPEALSPGHHIGPHTPPTLIVHGEKDTVVFLASVEVFAAEMKRAGRPCTLIRYPEAGHGFFNQGEAYRRTLAQADAFLVDLGWLEPAATE